MKYKKKHGTCRKSEVTIIIKSFNLRFICIKKDNLILSKCESYVPGDAMNLFLNDNWRNVAQEIKPVLEETVANLFKKFANKLFHKYPLDEILPP